MNRSISTVKADAAHISFSALGSDIVWAVIDSGIHAGHPHFKEHRNLEHDLEHRDLTGGNKPLEDGYGHGTHVAGILAGEFESKKPIKAVTRYRDKDGEITARPVEDVKRMAGMAPACKLLSLKVLDDAGKGETSNIITALEHIQELNGHGRYIRVHGVNLSVGYGFEPEWFACGQSPLCVEVDQLVKSGVVVVVAAGNTGYGYVQSEMQGPPTAGLGVTINDPGNANQAITVGSTHRDMPHIYGVSYFSSKGPTGDGRDKPDLVAPGEKILSCAAGEYRTRGAKQVDDAFEPDYVEDSGTSMAAPHVSGVIAGFLSIRQEFISQPHRIKEIFTSTATDLRRDRHFQGHGLVDVMRAIQSV
jgi:serine protease AprX